MTFSNKSLEQENVNNLLHTHTVDNYIQRFTQHAPTITITSVIHIIRGKLPFLSNT